MSKEAISVEDTIARSALKLALETLKHIHPSLLASFYTIVDRNKAIKALEEALKQEPFVHIGYWNQKTGAFYAPDQISEYHRRLIAEGILRRCYADRLA